MSSLFIKILNLSFTASFLIVACILVRHIFKKMPKYMRMLLWLLVAVRLLVPFEIESSLSLQPTKSLVSERISETAETAETSEVTAGSVEGNVKVAEDILLEESSDEMQELHNGALIDNFDRSVVDVLAIVWLVGVAAFIIYAFAMYFRLRYCVRDAVKKSKDVYLTDRIVSPFVLGIFRARIYMPFNLTEQEQFFVTSHERAHIARKDHLIKPAAFAVAAVYWFNPLVWVAYILLCRDIEFACDEKVIARIGYNMKKAYSQSILDLSMPRRYISACPVAFGETGVKERVRNILTMKKTKKIVLVTAVLAVVAVGIGFMTYPKKGSQEETTEAAEVTTEVLADSSEDAAAELDKVKAEKTGADSAADSEKDGADKTDSEKAEADTESDDENSTKVHNASLSFEDDEESEYKTITITDGGECYVLECKDGSWTASDNASGVNIISSGDSTTIYLENGEEIRLSEIDGVTGVASTPYTEDDLSENVEEEVPEVAPYNSEDTNYGYEIEVEEKEDGSVVIQPEEAPPVEED